ncbi:hypothetical protein BH11PLA2_BH11PLA2_28520 [soil metagenome]
MIAEINDNRITMHVKDQPDKGDLILLLDPKASPKRMVTKEEGKTAPEPAIYALETDGKKLRIRVKTTPKDENDYPKEVTVPKEGEKDAYFELTKIQ